MSNSREILTEKTDTLKYDPTASKQPDLLTEKVVTVRFTRYIRQLSGKKKSFTLQTQRTFMKGKTISTEI